MNEIHCKECGLFLGLCEQAVTIECPLCIELRYELKRALTVKVDQPFSAIGWKYAVTRKALQADEVSTRFSVLLERN